jgi:hypothetical protein
MMLQRSSGGSSPKPPSDSGNSNVRYYAANGVVYVHADDLIIWLLKNSRKEAAESWERWRDDVLKETSG